MLGVFLIAQDNANKYYTARMPERERRMPGLQPVAWITS